MAPLLPPTGLAVEEVLPQLRAALDGAGHAVLVAPPGAGKTSVVPLRLLDERWLAGRRIVVLEPRRVAARAAARRMASLLGERVGDTAGYRTRDERRVGSATRVEVVTEGILTRRLQRDAALPGVGLVVLDEFHERHLQADLALALALEARAVLRPDLRLLVMSASLQAEPVAALLGGDGPPAPVVVSATRHHPVDVRWVPARPRERLAEAAARTTLAVLGGRPPARPDEGEGDVLVFLPGAADIRRVEALLAPAVGPEVDVRPLFGALSAAEQDLALAPSQAGRRRVVLATDIAETSLTVDGVRVVVDSGQSRTPRYDARRGLTTLQTGAISRASADQRAGRAGRQGPGVAYRLWSQFDHATRRAFSLPEIAGIDLAGFALDVAVWGTPPGELALLDPPPDGAWREAVALLAQLGALDGDGRLTTQGRAMAELPVHPRVARMVLGAGPLALGWTACVLAAVLEERDILRGRPDEVPVDVVARAELVARDQRGAAPAAADRQALGAVRRRAAELAARAGVREGPLDPMACGRLLALAYPDRVAQARGGGRFRLRGGTGAWIPQGDPLAGEAFVVAAELDADRRDARVRLAASLDLDELLDAAGGDVEVVTTLAWDDRRDDLRARREQRLGALVLQVAEGPAASGPATVEALLARVRATRSEVLRWTPQARALQARITFLRMVQGGRWPDVSDAALSATIEQWLAPRLAGATGRADLERVDLRRVLADQLAPGQAAELDRLAPTSLRLGARGGVAVDYGEERPTSAVRVQDLFGTTVHPTVAGGVVPVVLVLLSPAGRPLQVTSDLPSFWRGSWAQVRKEMAGRYPKHAWPVDPS